MYLIVYLKPNYKTISRLYKNISYDLEIGFINGYGWEIVNIQQLENKKFYTLKTINKIIEEKENKINKHNSRIMLFISFIDTLLYA